MLNRASTLACVLGILTSPALAQQSLEEVDISRPALIITNEPIPYFNTEEYCKSYLKKAASEGVKARESTNLRR